MRNFKLLITALALFVGAISFGNKVTVYGVYKGQNLIVQNGYYAEGKIHCVTSIYVNDKKLNVDVTVSAVSIDFRSLKIEKGDKLKIDIYHHRECGAPKILNMQAIEKDGRFHISSVKVTERKISWLAQGEQPGGTYYIEHMENGEWTRVLHVEEKGDVSEDYYQYPVHHFSGVNQYRIAYLEADSTVIYSSVATVTSHVLPISANLFEVQKTITFSRSCKFIITDLKHKVIIRGEGKTVDCSALTPKEYYTILFDNQVHHFKKAKIKKEKKKKEKK